MTELISFSIAKKWLSRLYGELESIKSSRADELDKLNENFGDPLELSRYYIEPDCQQFNPADDSETEDLYIVREPIFRRIQGFINERRPNKSNHMFVLSDAGMGKTSLLVILRLSYIVSFWPKKFTCVLLKSGADTLKEIETIKNKRTTVLLIDAIDEDPLAFVRTKDRINEIFLATQNYRTVIVTCRTQFFSAGNDPFNRRGQVETGGFLVPVVYLSLFSNCQVNEYLDKRFAGNPNKEELKNASLRIVNKIGSLRMRPMILAHIEDFLEADVVQWTEYSLYEALIRVWLLREYRKIEYNHIETDVDSLWCACRSVALHMSKKKTNKISTDDLEKLITGHPKTKLIKLIDVKGRSLLTKDSDESYRFSHYSIQEFLVLNSIVKFKLDPLAERLKLTDQITRFFSSWLSLSSLNEAINIRLNFFNLSLIRKNDISSLDLNGMPVDIGLLFKDNLTIEEYRLISDSFTESQRGNLMVYIALIKRLTKSSTTLVSRSDALTRAG